MLSLADLPELVGFFSYSRDDDEGSMGALSSLRDAIQRELSAQLGRTKKNFRLWQDREAIAPGKLWESQIKTAIEQSAFFIPIVTPRTVKSGYCKREFEAFLARESAIGRNDLVFPILYVTVASLENEERWRSDPVLEIIGRRQYVDWRSFRHRRVDDTAVREAIELFSSKIVDALSAPIAELPPLGESISGETRQSTPAAEKASPQEGTPAPRESRRQPDEGDAAGAAGPRAAQIPDPPRAERIADASIEGSSAGQANSGVASVAAGMVFTQRRHDVPSSAAASDPALHLAGGFMVILGVFLSLFGISFLFYDKPSGALLWDLVVLAPAIAVLATGLGTITQQEWARVVGTIVCFVGVPASGFFVWMGIAAFARRNEWLWLGLAALCSVLAVVFGAGGVDYARRWQTWAGKFPAGEASNRAFRLFLVVCCLFNLTLFIIVGSYEYSPIHEFFLLWLLLLIAADGVASTYCYRRFQRADTSGRPVPATGTSS